ncbi:MAG: aconitate hydratase AcnA [Chloroflexi bacterium]|nr:aconitate hydratase AcnA [Chloroflexota bacterium]
MSTANSFESKSTFTASGSIYTLYRLAALEKAGIGNVARLPFSIKVLLESLLRTEDGRSVMREDVVAAANWAPQQTAAREINFTPARVILQDFTGVPSVVDLAAMREAISALGGDPERINPLQPADLIIDHSVQVDVYGTSDAFAINAQREFARNQERYAFLRWGQKAFDNFSIVPPDTGIVHQVNLEYLGRVVFADSRNGELVAYPDSLVGTDSHTTMINGLGVLAWGVGGIEAEAVMLGQPISLLLPEVVGFRLRGQLPEGATATDLVLTVTQMLRQHGVVGKFVEFCGPGMASLSLPDRATISNMAPEYGATVGMFPVDAETLRYLRLTGRDEDLVQLVEAYCKEQGMFYRPADPEPLFTDTLELDLASVEPSLAGPKRPQDRVALQGVRQSFVDAYPEKFAKTNGNGAANGSTAVGAAAQDTGSVAIADPAANIEVSVDGVPARIGEGAVVIAAITSCTNTSNPAVMIGAGLLAKNAVKAGIGRKPWVKTSLAPGSRVVMDYLEKLDLVPHLEALGFHLVGYGCTTCIGNSGPLAEPLEETISEHELAVAAVLSGNRNFEGRIHALVRASYLASPPLVVAYALAGTVNTDLTNDPIGHDDAGRPIYLRDIWPSQREIADAMTQVVDAEMFREQYDKVFEGMSEWETLAVPEGTLFAWDEDSTYVRQPPFFADMEAEPGSPANISDARVLAVVGDSVTTDHISPAGSIAKDSPAGKYLIEQGVQPKEFNSYGSRRGNHEVMMRGTFANVRLRNLLVSREGGWTLHLPDETETTIYDASVQYQNDGVPLIILAGKDYGMGSSRDWAAKGPVLLGVRAVIAESYERIHRSNLVGMGVLPLQYAEGETAESLGLNGHETFTIEGIAEGLSPRKTLTVRARDSDGNEKTFAVTARINTPIEVDYYRHGGVLQYVLRNLLADNANGEAD